MADTIHPGRIDTKNFHKANALATITAKVTDIVDVRSSTLLSGTGAEQSTEMWTAEPALKVVSLALAVCPRAKYSTD